VVGRNVGVLTNVGYKGKGVIGDFDLKDDSQIIPFVAKFKTVFNDEVELITKKQMEELGFCPDQTD